MPHAKRAAAPRKTVRARKPTAPSRKRAALRKTTPPLRKAGRFAHNGGRPRDFFTPEFMVEARRRIEHTLQSMTSIAADFGMHHSVLSRLSKRKGWIRPEGSLRRRGLSPVMRLAAAADALAHEAPIGPLTPTPTLPLAGGGSPTERAAPASLAPPAPDTVTIDRLEAAVLKELATVETMRASLGAEPLRPMDAERTARTLSVLTETMAKLRRLRLGGAPQSGSDHDDDIPDIDEFRRDLARRIEAFVASRPDDESAAGDRDVALEPARQ